MKHLLITTIAAVLLVGCSNPEEMFLSVTEARVVIEEWRCFYNRVHPESRLGFKSPEDYARRSARPGLLCAAATPTV